MLDHSRIQHLRDSFHGQLLTPSHAEYDEARQVFNAMIDRRPALIARCAGPSDVISCVRFARENDMVVSVRSGGHGVAGNAVCDDGLVIDLSRMKGVRVDTGHLTARADAGVILGEFDHATQAFGLATTLGTFSPTGIAGLTLGGGLGWLMGRYGLACDNLLSADVVTADGSLLSASERQNPELFWGLRGGGGNFGVVTSFEYQLHPVGSVLAGLVAHPISEAERVLRFFREFASTAPDELGLMPAMLTLSDGNTIVGVAGVYSGDLRTGEEVLKPLRSFGSPVADLFQPMQYTDVQKMLDWWASSRRRHYWKSGFLQELSDDVINVMVHFARTKPSNFSGAAVEYLHGAVRRPLSAATAFPHRNSPFSFLMLGSWGSAAEDDSNMRWVREFWNAMEPFLGGVYVNYLSENEGEQRVRNAYGTNYERLLTLKQNYDPTNFFCMNQNIRAAKTAA
jgi:FAD/FMN-containing dehydrogenase